MNESNDDVRGERGSLLVHALGEVVGVFLNLA